MQVICHTNLDLDSREIFPDSLPALPHVGDEIASGHKWENGVSVHFKIVSITWKMDPQIVTEHGINRAWFPHIELHLTSYWEKQSLRDFYIWYGAVTGRGASAFI
jgi:hypothetical protein